AWPYSTPSHGPDTGASQAAGAFDRDLDLQDPAGPGFERSPPPVLALRPVLHLEPSPPFRTSLVPSQSTTATASISMSHPGSASAVTPTRVLAGGAPFVKKGARAWPMTARCSGL